MLFFRKKQENTSIQLMVLNKTNQIEQSPYYRDQTRTLRILNEWDRVAQATNRELYASHNLAASQIFRAPFFHI